MMKTKYKKVSLVLSLLLLLPIQHQALAQFKSDKIQPTSLWEMDTQTHKIYPTIHYNRVEGLFLGTGFNYSPAFAPVTVLAEGGYGISNKEWRYRSGIFMDLFEANRFRIGTEAFHLTSSLDDWRIGSIENSLAALLFKEDFIDYFGKKGYMLYLNQLLLDNQIQLRFEAAAYEYSMMNRQTDWALLGKNKHFAENPAVAEIDETSLKFVLFYDGRDNPVFPLSGWTIEGIYEHTLEDSTTNGFFVTIKRFQPTFRTQRLRFKMMLGARNGSSAEQHTMDLGGIGTLPGFREKEFKNGNRFLLLNFQYLFSGDVLRNLPLSFIPIYDALTLSLFCDTGWLSFEETNDFGFNELGIADLKTDLGISLSISEDMFKVDFGKRTDRGYDDWRITCRLFYKL